MFLTDIPWARVLSCNPLFIDPLGVPPGYCGLSIHTNESDWAEARAKRAINFDDLLNKTNAWYAQEGAKPIERFFSNWHSPFINFYLYPQEVDYFDEQIKMDGNWVRIDCCIESIQTPIELPNWFKALPGKTFLFFLL